jgi:Pyridoxamine 5'-phosphate oxidase
LSRRDQIHMTSEEVDEFLERQRVVICATNGREGWPHLMPLWYLVRDGEIWSWTYAKSQKVRNLERDARATLQIEDGEQYHELRGVMIEADTVIHRGLDEVAEFGAALFERYGGAVGGGGPEFLEVIRGQASKRVALQFVARQMATWDHGKLGGVY